MNHVSRALVVVALLVVLPTRARTDTPRRLPRASGYRGIWYSNQPSGDRYRFKYSGGFATYPQQHMPIAVHAPAAHKTFFCYGGRAPDANRLLHMVSYFDHRTGRVPRPAVLLDKRTADAHDNPTLAIDGEGHLWVFSNAHGTSRPSFIHRSVRPYSIDAFERILETNFSYGQPWYLPDHGLVLLHTRYQSGRRLFVMTSPDGTKWGEPLPLARIEKGHYQVSWPHGKRLGTAFNMHPEPVGLNARTNLYYLESADGGRSWRNAAGEEATLPLEQAANPALVRDFAASGELVYLKDLEFDAGGRPVVLFLTSRGYRSGPESGPREWKTARWTGSAWKILPLTTSDHNYDHGSLYIEPDGTWRVIAPTDPGARPWTTGGDIVVWTSSDQGASWKRAATLTRDPERNHGYVRKPLGAHPEFYALWADGDPLAESPSSLWFTDREGHVRRLPASLTGEEAEPELVDWPEATGRPAADGPGASGRRRP